MNRREIIGVVACACCTALGGEATIRSESRLAFVRGEKDAKIVLSVRNDSTQNWAAVTLHTPFGVKVKMLANLDDAQGGYRLVAKDRASGLVAERR